MSQSSALGDPTAAEVAAGPIVYRETGSGEPIVFVHGLLVNGDLWRKVVPPLAESNRCITPDWPLGSHERGMNPDADFSLPGLAAMVGDLLAALDLRDVTLVANDTGGAIAQWVLARHRDRLARVVLTPCDAFDNFVPPILRHLKLSARYPAPLRLAGHAVRLRPIERLPIAYGRTTLRPFDRDAIDSYSLGLRTNGDVRRDFSRLVREIDPRYTQEAAAELEGCGVEARVVWSSHTGLFPLEHGERLAELLAAGPPRIVDDSAAFIPEDQPGELSRLIAEFAGTPAATRGQAPGTG